MGRQLGLSREQLAALPRFEEGPQFDGLERCVLRYSVGITATPVEVSDELFGELRAHFNEKQLVELTSCIAWENYRARFDHAFGVESEGFDEGSLRALPPKP